MGSQRKNGSLCWKVVKEGFNREVTSEEEFVSLDGKTISSLFFS
jgi:hypothetical protein